LTMAVMMTALIVLGIYPQPILDISRPVVESLISFSSIVTGGSL
jgi:NADH:ubiquinone oxidoreductase subunit 4 (subunit M)